MNYFSGKTALITGASAGIGEEFAKQLHDCGSNVIVVARRADKLKTLTDAMNVKRSGSARMITADLTSLADIEKVTSVITSERIDILVNNAGRGSFGFFEENPLEAELEVISLNVTATVHLTHAVLPQMKERGEGAIVSVSSIAGFQPIPYLATYAGTKAFNLYHSLALRSEVRKFGIRVVTLCPGPTATEFGGVARFPGTATGIHRESAEKVVSDALEALNKNSPIVIPGIRAWCMAILSRTLPVTLTTWITEKTLRPVVERAKALKNKGGLA